MSEIEAKTQPRRRYPFEYALGLAEIYHAPILLAPCNLIGSYNMATDDTGRATGTKRLYQDAGITPPPLGHISRVVVEIRGEKKIKGQVIDHFNRVEIGEYDDIEIETLRDKATQANVMIRSDYVGYICGHCFQTGLMLEDKRLRKFLDQTHQFLKQMRENK